MGLNGKKCLDVNTLFVFIVLVQNGTCYIQRPSRSNILHRKLYLGSDLDRHISSLSSPTTQLYATAAVYRPSLDQPVIPQSLLPSTIIGKLILIAAAVLTAATIGQISRRQRDSSTSSSAMARRRSRGRRAPDDDDEDDGIVVEGLIPRFLALWKSLAEVLRQAGQTAVTRLKDLLSNTTGDVDYEEESPAEEEDRPRRAGTTTAGRRSARPSSSSTVWRRAVLAKKEVVNDRFILYRFSPSSAEAGNSEEIVRTDRKILLCTRDDERQQVLKEEFFALRDGLPPPPSPYQEVDEEEEEGAETVRSSTSSTTSSSSFGVITRIFKRSNVSGDEVSSLLPSLSLGDEVAFRTVAQPVFRYRGSADPILHLTLVASGSGILPLLELIARVLREAVRGESSLESMSLLWINDNEADFVFDRSVQRLEEEHDDRFKFAPVIDNALLVEGSVLSREVQESLPEAEPGRIGIVAGPAIVLEKFSRALSELGYADDDIVAIPM